MYDAAEKSSYYNGRFKNLIKAYYAVYKPNQYFVIPQPIIKSSSLSSNSNSTTIINDNKKHPRNKSINFDESSPMKKKRIEENTIEVWESKKYNGKFFINDNVTSKFYF
jgi:hypothetical protein